MVKIIIEKNDAEQRIDRFLRKYLKKAPLSRIYKLLRKDIKLNGRRVSNDAIISAGDEISIYMDPGELAELAAEDRGSGRQNALLKAKKQFKIAYEDDNILVAVKPAGLLTHGDGKTAEGRKYSLVNQVVDYLIEKGDYVPRIEKSFKPAAANRLDRNTSGLVLFGKNAASLRALNSAVRERGCVKKIYMALVCGEITERLDLGGSIVKDERRNKVTIMQSSDGGDGSRRIETIIFPERTAGDYTLVRAELVTGRTHQIRAHLSHAGYPIVGDEKYGNAKLNSYFRKRYGLTHQLLHAWRITLMDAPEPLVYLNNTEFKAEMPDKMKKIIENTLWGNV